MPAKIGRPPDQKKDRAILEAAQKILFSVGPQALTMEAVAKRAKISKATLYSRYANRLALLQEIVARDTFNIHRPLQTTPQTHEELHNDLVDFIDTLILFLCGDHHHHLMLALSEFPQSSQDLTQIYHNGPEKVHQTLSVYLQQAALHGLICCPEPHQSAEMLLGLAIGLDLIRAQYRVPLNRQEPTSRRTHTQQMIKAFMVLHTNAVR